VIARNSSFVYKGQAVDIKKVSRELGARYVVEGSVRKAGDRVRVSAQLIDASSGGHVWAERYDRQMDDIFALQDEITQSIVASMHPQMERFERDKASHLEPQNLDAWECVMRGYWHRDKWSKEENKKAQSFFERATELDPQCAEAFRGLALMHANAVWFQWSDSEAQSIAEMTCAAQRSVELDPSNAGAQHALSVAFMFAGRLDEGIAAAERSVKLNPSDCEGRCSLGIGLACSGRPDEGLTQIAEAIRLSPCDHQMFLYAGWAALAHFAAGRYESAVEWAKTSLRDNPKHVSSWRFLAASYAHLGRVAEARSALDEALRLAPGLSLTSLKFILPSVFPAFAEAVIDGLRKAGLKE
jgi:adenylate cyclase